MRSVLVYRLVVAGINSGQLHSLHVKMALVSFGNPLLDATVDVDNTDLHKEFDLPLDGQLEVNELQKELFNIAIKGYHTEYSAGGCALNASRVLSWLLNGTRKVVFIGSIGSDENALILQRIVEESGVICRFIKSKKKTGFCVALVYGENRCLCADISAAADFKLENVLHCGSFKVLDEAKYVYIEGYLLTHSFDSALEIATLCRRKKKILIFNLCADYVVRNFTGNVMKILSHVNILFGNYSEYFELRKQMKVECANSHTDLIRNLFVIFKYFDKVSGEESQVIIEDNSSLNNSSVDPFQVSDFVPDKSLVVMTCGSDPVVYGHSETIYEYPVKVVSPDSIVDTIGAGDSFVGGFLAALLLDKSLMTCLDCGVWAAQQILQQKGCRIPSRIADYFSSVELQKPVYS